MSWATSDKIERFEIFVFSMCRYECYKHGEMKMEQYLTRHEFNLLVKRFFFNILSKKSFYLSNNQKKYRN